MLVQKHPAIGGFYYTVKTDDEGTVLMSSGIYPTEGLCHQALFPLVDALRDGVKPWLVAKADAAFQAAGFAGHS